MGFYGDTAFNYACEECESFATPEKMVRLKGFEPLTYGLEVRCSIQLSYRRI
jgi:hypothetical protein